MICTVHKRGTRKNSPRSQHPLSTLGVEVQRDKKRVLAAVDQDGHALKVRAPASGQAQSRACLAANRRAVPPVAMLRYPCGVLGTVTLTCQIFHDGRCEATDSCDHASANEPRAHMPSPPPAHSAALTVALASSLVRGCEGLTRPRTSGVRCGDTRPTRATRELIRC